MLIKDFRKVIEEKTQVPVDRQRLIYKAKLLSDDQKISNYSEYIICCGNNFV